MNTVIATVAGIALIAGLAGVLDALDIPTWQRMCIGGAIGAFTVMIGRSLDKITAVWEHHEWRSDRLRR